MLAQRVATALVGVPIILSLIAWGGVAYSLAVAAILVLATLEFFAATDPERSPQQRGGLLHLFEQRPTPLLGAAVLVPGEQHVGIHAEGGTQSPERERCVLAVV